MLVFAESFLEAEAVEERYVVAGAAEVGSGDAEELFELAVDFLAGLVGMGDQVLGNDGFLELGVAPGRTINGLRDFALIQWKPAAHLAHWLADAVADDAGHAL